MTPEEAPILFTLIRLLFRPKLMISALVLLLTVDDDDFLAAATTTTSLRTPSATNELI